MSNSDESPTVQVHLGDGSTQLPTMYPAMDYIQTDQHTQYGIADYGGGTTIIAGKVMKTSYSVDNSPDICGSGPRMGLENPVFKRKIGMRELFFVSEADVQLFDQIQEYRSANIQQHDFKSALNSFCQEPNGDAIVKMVYGAPFYDFILKFRNDSKPESKDIREAFEDKLMEQGLYLEYEPTVDEQETYVKVIVPFERMCKEAETCNLQFPLKEDPIDVEMQQENQKHGSMHSLVDYILSSLEKQNVRPPSGYFSRAEIGKFVCGDAPLSELQYSWFSTAQRILLTYNIIYRIRLQYQQGHRNSYTIHRLLRHKVYTEFYPLHDGSHKLPLGTMEKNLRAKLDDIWVNRWFRRQPLDEIRVYFGEKIALYFAWLGYYVQWLFLAAIVGAGVFAYGIVKYYNDNPARIFDNEISPYYAFFVSLWSVMFLEFWKRKNIRLSFQWEVMDYEKEETIRPEWVATKARVSPITHKLERHVSRAVSITKLIATSWVVFVSILIVLVSVAATIVFRVWAYQSAWPNNPTIATIVSAVLCLAVMMLLANVYDKIARKLTNFENHKTETEFENALIAKKFLFDFVNSYSGLFYIALIKQLYQFPEPGILNQRGWIDKCSQSGNYCLYDLMIQLAIISVGKQAVNQFLEFATPFIGRLWNAKVMNKKLEELHDGYARRVGSSEKLNSLAESTVIPQWVKDDMLGKHTGLTADYNEMALQYGFVTLFVCVFPLGPLFALLNNIVEIRVDASRMVINNQRPVPLPASKIGTWFKILQAISYFAVISNACIVAFASSYFYSVYLKDYTDETSKLVARLVFVIVFEHLVFGIQFLMAYLIPDVPGEIKHAKAREEYLARVKLEGDPEVEHDPEALEIYRTKHKKM